MNYSNFYSEKQSTLTYGKHISTYGKFIIIEVLIYQVNFNEFHEDEDKYQQLKNAIDEIMESKDLSNIDQLWDKLLNKLNLNSPEEMMYFAFEIFKPAYNSLLFRTFYTFGKIKPLSASDSWFDNFRINGLSNGINNIVWQDYDKEKTYGIRRNPKPINTSIELTDYERIIRFLVGELRKFIIENDLYQTNEKYILKIPSNHLSDQEICDRCYMMYPFYYGGACVCDFYLYEHVNLSIDEIVEFMNRYPSAYIGYVLNTAPFTLHCGKHWICVMFHENVLYVVDSGGKNLSNFLDDGAFKNEINTKGIITQFNPIKFQTDTYSCGMFSVISMYLLLCYDCDIEKAVGKMGHNGSGLVAGKDITSFTQILAYPQDTF